MDKSVRKTVTLPDGQSVTISEVPESWWSKHDASGYIDPKLLAPDLDQPRKSMNQAKLAELHESIATRGVRNPLVVSPREKTPWARVAPADEHLPFVIVSGHRRRSGAVKKAVKAVPIQVRIYGSEKDYRLDASLLNKGSEELTPIEEGWEIIELRKTGCTVAEICDSFGMSAPQYYNRLYLTMLHPDIQKCLSPELSEKKRLASTLGGDLGSIKTPGLEELRDAYEKYYKFVRESDIYSPDELGELDEDNRRFALQKLLFAVIQVRKLAGERAQAFVRENSRSLAAAVDRSAGGRKTEAFKPSKRMEVFRNLLKGVEGSVVLDWTPSEWKRVTEYLDYEELAALIKAAENAQSLFGGIIRTLKDRQATKKPTSPAVLEARRKLLELERRK